MANGKSLAAGLIGAALIAGAANAGAWTRPAGEGFTSQTFRYFKTTGGETPFERASLTAYAEYGVFERITVGGELDQGARLDEAMRGQQTGRAAAFVRGRIWSDDAGYVASIQLGGSTPLSGFVSPAAPGGDESDEFEGQIMIGRGFVSEYGNGWAETSLGFSHFTGPRADEAKLDLTLGLRPDENWIALAQMFATFGLQNNAFGGTDFDTVKLQLSIGRKLFGDKTFLLNIARDIHTRNTDPGLEISVSVWSSF